MIGGVRGLYHERDCKTKDSYMRFVAEYVLLNPCQRTPENVELVLASLLEHASDAFDDILSSVEFLMYKHFSKYHFGLNFDFEQVFGDSQGALILVNSFLGRWNPNADEAIDEAIDAAVECALYLYINEGVARIDCFKKINDASVLKEKRAFSKNWSSKHHLTKMLNNRLGLILRKQTPCYLKLSIAGYYLEISSPTRETNEIRAVKGNSQYSVQYQSNGRKDTIETVSTARKGSHRHNALLQILEGIDLQTNK